MAIRFRPLGREDFATLSEWLAAPHVEPWWREAHDRKAVEARYGPGVDGLEPTEHFVVEQDGEPIGLVQRYRLADNPDWATSLAPAGPPPDAAGIDYLIGVESLTGKGIGGVIIDRFVEATWQGWPDVRAVVVAVQQGNRRSWRALEKAQFRRTWAGELDSDDPSDAGPTYVYTRRRP